MRSVDSVIVMSHVWYVSYGSNMSADRFACFIEGYLEAIVPSLS